MIAERPGVELHHQPVFHRLSGHLHQQVGLEPRLIFVSGSSTHRSEEQSIDFALSQSLRSRTHYTVIGGYCARRLELGSALDHRAEQFLVTPDVSADGFSEAVDL